jgi:hypothetical protein
VFFPQDPADTRRSFPVGEACQPWNINGKQKSGGG